MSSSEYFSKVLNWTVKKCMIFAAQRFITIKLDDQIWLLQLIKTDIGQNQTIF